MSKKSNDLKTTTNSRVYKLLRYNVEKLTYCPICSPNRGCNRWTRRFPRRNWKHYRKFQWKKQNKTKHYACLINYIDLKSILVI